MQFHLAKLVDTVDPGERVFNIRLEPGTPNEVVLRNVDVCKAAGRNTAYMLPARVTVEDYALNINFEPVHGQTMLAGIKL